MSKSHSVRVRPDRWREIEKHAWKLSQEAGKLVKPTDIVDAVILLKTKEIELEDVDAARKNR
ncbi:MAG: hypothetical protein GX771_04545 [Halomonadaceae bacterium]|nr:hypothetical protein [Halomonadaceae bacterium]